MLQIQCVRDKAGNQPNHSVKLGDSRHNGGDVPAGASLTGEGQRKAT